VFDLYNVVDDSDVDRALKQIERGIAAETKGAHWSRFGHS
jgi:hypothetical protein